MEKIPNMISTKDLSYISDMFNWHLVAAKKIWILSKSMWRSAMCKKTRRIIWFTL